MLPTEFRSNYGWLFRIIDSNDPSRKGSLAFGSHWHHEIEIVVMRHGHCDAYLNSDLYKIDDDCLFISFPDQTHSYLENSTEGQDYYIIMLSPSAVPQFEEKYKGLIPQNPLLKDLSSHKTITSLLDMIYNATIEENLKNTELLQGLLYAFFGALKQETEFVPESKNFNKTLNRVIHYCSLNYKNDISLSQMSEDLGISAPHLSRLFVKKMQVNFNTYINILRISEAQRLLVSTSQSIQKIGERVGFSCIRSFNRAFAKITEVTPTEYRKNLNKGSEKKKKARSNGDTKEKS